MEQSSYKEIAAEHQFDSYCKKTLRGEAREDQREKNKQSQREVLFSELPQRELDRLCIWDNYFEQEHGFRAKGHNIYIRNELIAEAIKSLPEQKRVIILLSYFLDMSDPEIAKTLSVTRTTVRYQRTCALTQLKNIMEDQ